MPAALEKPVIAPVFPVGFYHFHDDQSLNFQMNRWVNWLGSGVEDMRKIAPKIKNYDDWKREMLALAEEVLAQGCSLNAAFYLRSAEFFMTADDPQKQPTYDRFVQMVHDHYGISKTDRHLIPYESGFLPAYRFCPDQPKGTLVWFGGFDAYIEELFPIMFLLRDAGYEVVAFEGPGQGAALEKYGLPMTHQWEKPVKAVLDYFKLDHVTLIGLSLGGCLVLRAAAEEPRVERVIADDILFNFQEVLLHTLPPLARRSLNVLLTVQAAGLVNWVFAQIIKRNLLVEWGVHQGMHVMGVPTPYDFLRKTRQFITADISQ
ncbi:MAG TPA: alpha/beta fold hydrolase [Oculatellaceae cyanobacterium]